MGRLLAWALAACLMAGGAGVLTARGDEGRMPLLKRLRDERKANEARAHAEELPPWLPRRPRATKPCHETHHDDSCAGDWPSFGKCAMTSSQWHRSPSNRPRNFTDFVHGSFFQGLYINPDHNFAMCLIEKNGCTAWSKILSKIHAENPDFERINYYLTSISFDDYGAEGAEAVFSNPDATRVVMVRDPIERFLSAFLDKCFDRNCGNAYCFPRRYFNVTRGEPISLQDAVKWFLEKNPAKLDGHWKLQSEHCELKDRIDEYNVIGLLTKDTLARDAACIMERAHLEKFNRHGPRVHLAGQRYWQPRPDHSGNAEDIELLKKFFTREAVEQLMEHLRQDYDVFNFAAPSWIDEATGDWFDRINMNACTEQVSKLAAVRAADSEADESAEGGSSFGQQFMESVMREDDIVALAKRAGYL